ncbi:uncharacterized protein [Diabrotica undecimpunctata]|uniref:uncharacterized protein n=1 Tax=Diabrotica undecimpunctata TaxID=50387 RepID=UPI003B640511
MGEIQGLTNANQWHHVKSADNPADLLSRGTTTDILIGSRLWWHGPQWLETDSSQWSIKDVIQGDNLPEQRTVISLSVNNECTMQVNIDLFKRFSFIIRLQRVVAYIIRFMKNTKLAKEQREIGSR